MGGKGPGWAGSSTSDVGSFELPRSSTESTSAMTRAAPLQIVCRRPPLLGTVVLPAVGGVAWYALAGLKRSEGMRGGGSWTSNAVQTKGKQLKSPARPEGLRREILSHVQCNPLLPTNRLKWQPLPKGTPSPSAERESCLLVASFRNLSRMGVRRRRFRLSS
jgi:hypothetical protein